MSVIKWNTPGTRLFEAGVQKGVLYPKKGPGVPWNGLISVSEKAEGGAPKVVYLDGIKIRNTIPSKEFAATITAFTYPDELAPAEGVVAIAGSNGVGEAGGMSFDNQTPEEFGMSYRTEIGNDTEGISHGYKLHLVYNALITPPSRDRKAISGNPDPLAFTWDITTTPVMLLGYRPTAHFIFDSTKTDEFLMDAIEEMLYGTETKAPRLPTPNDFIALYAGWLSFKVVDNKDGTWTATGPPEVIKMISSTMFSIDWYSATLTGPDSYTLSSK